MRCLDDRRSDGSAVSWLRWLSVGMWSRPRPSPDGYGITVMGPFVPEYFVKNELVRDLNDTGEVAA